MEYAKLNLHYFLEDRVRRLLVIPILVRFIPSLLMFIILLLPLPLLERYAFYRNLLLGLSGLEIISGLILGTKVISKIQKDEDTKTLVAAELVIDVFILGILMLVFPKISWPIFIFFTPEILGGAYGLSKTIPYYIAAFASIFVILEQLIGQPVDLLTLGIRFAFLAETAYYSSLLGETLISEKEKAEHNKKLLGELEDANLQIRSIGKLKSDLLNMASHEFRTPIGTIKNALWFINKEEVLAKLSDKEKVNVERITKSTERLDYLLQNMSELLATTSGDLKLDLSPTQIEILVNDVISTKTDEAEEQKVAISFNQPEKPLPQLMADPTKLKYVLWELLTNALKYSKEGSTVTISTNQNEQEVTVAISDTGTGISRQELNHLLDEPFSKGDYLHTTQPGLGLGLYIVKRILDLHGGKMKIDSEEGKGTKVSISLPLKKEEEKQRPKIQENIIESPLPQEEHLAMAGVILPKQMGWKIRWLN